MIPLTANASGAVNGELQYQEYDILMAAALQNAWTVFGYQWCLWCRFQLYCWWTGCYPSITASAAPTGADAFTNLQKGQWFRLTALVMPAMTVKIVRVSTTTAPTTTVITLDANTPLTLNAGTVANCKIATSRRLTVLLRPASLSGR